MPYPDLYPDLYPAGDTVARAGWPAWKVEAKFGAAYIDISQWVQEFTIDRPGSRQQGPVVVYEAGTCTVTLNNSDARFTPGNLSGPYVSGGVTQVRPMIPIRITAVWNAVTYKLFAGWVSSWSGPAEWLGPKYDYTVASATDGQRILEGTTLPEVTPVGAGELSGARVNRILDAAGWPGGGSRNIYTGQSNVASTAFGDSALSLIQATALTELGEFFFDGGGVAVFRDRDALLNDTRSNTVQGVFGDLRGTSHAAGTEVPYVALSNPTDDTTMANVVQATRDGGTMQQVSDAASITKYLFPRTYTADVLLLSDTDVNNWASYVLYLGKNDETRFDELTLKPVNWATDLWPHALGRELGDLIQVWARPPGIGSPLSQNCFIRGISHEVNVDEWTTTWTLQDAARYTGAPDFAGNASNFFVLNDAVLGLLDTGVLGF